MTWSFLDLVTGRDGKLVPSKLQASTFHALLSMTVAWITWKTEKFNLEMWGLYAAVAVGHAVIDKGTAQIKEFKEKKLEQENANQG